MKSLEPATLLLASGSEPTQSYKRGYFLILFISGTAYMVYNSTRACAKRCSYFVNRYYRIAGIFRGVIFSWFSWSRGEPRNVYPRTTPRARAQNRRQTARPRNFFHEIAKITTFTKILPLEKYPLYGIHVFLAKAPGFRSSSKTGLAALEPPKQPTEVRTLIQTLGFK